MGISISDHLAIKKTAHYWLFPYQRFCDDYVKIMSSTDFSEHLESSVMAPIYLVLTLEGVVTSSLDRLFYLCSRPPGGKLFKKWLKQTYGQNLAVKINFLVKEFYPGRPQLKEEIWDKFKPLRELRNRLVHAHELSVKYEDGREVPNDLHQRLGPVRQKEYYDQFWQTLDLFFGLISNIKLDLDRHSNVSEETLEKDLSYSIGIWLKGAEKRVDLEAYL